MKERHKRPVGTRRSLAPPPPPVPALIERRDRRRQHHHQAYPNSGRVWVGNFIFLSADMANTPMMKLSFITLVCGREKTFPYPNEISVRVNVGW